MAGESDDGEAAGVAPKLPKRHSPAIIMRACASTRPRRRGSISRAARIDIWPLYLFHEGAQTINAAISLRAHCTLTSRRDYRVALVSDDTGEQVEAADPAALGVDRLPLVARLVRHFGARGVDVHTRSDSPVGAGIAGSSAMNVAVAGALAAWTGRHARPTRSC